MGSNKSARNEQCMDSLAYVAINNPVSNKFGFCFIYRCIASTSVLETSCIT